MPPELYRPGYAPLDRVKIHDIKVSVEFDGEPLDMGIYNARGTDAIAFAENASAREVKEHLLEMLNNIEVLLEEKIDQNTEVRRYERL